jgi:hypothetical protein
MIRLATEEFVPVSADDWYQRRRRDAEGEFWRKVADQGPRKGVGGTTRQGIYTFTASGKLLSYKNAHEASTMVEAVQLGLKRFKALPASEREPGAVKVPDAGKVDPTFHRLPPEGGLILRSYTRILDRDAEKGYVAGTCDFKGGDKAARDHVWLKKDEWQSLIPARPTVGEVSDVPERIVRRLCRFHLLDNTRGEPNYWGPDEVRKAELKAKVAKADGDAVVLELSGSAKMTTKDEKRGYEVALKGHIEYDRAKKAITAFEILAVGDHWGRGTYTGGARPGRNPLGVVMELVKGEVPAERVPPQASREIEAYYAAR